MSFHVFALHLLLAYRAFDRVLPMHLLGVSLETFRGFKRFVAFVALEGSIGRVDATVVFQMTFQPKHFVAQRALESRIVAVFLLMTVESRFGLERHVTLIALIGPRVRVRHDMLEITTSQFEGFAANFAGFVMNVSMQFHLFLAGKPAIATRMRTFEQILILFAFRPFMPISAAFAFEFFITMFTRVCIIRVRVQMLLQMLRLDESLFADVANVFSHFLFLFIVRVLRHFQLGKHGKIGLGEGHWRCEGSVISVVISLNVLR